MANKIKRNLVFLADNLRELTKVLVYLVQEDIISVTDRQVFEAKTTPFEKNDELLKMIQTKNWDSIKDIFLDILRKTNNKFCADRIEGPSSSSSPSNRNVIRHPKISKQNCWWPQKKRLIESLHRRKYGDRFLVEELHDRISKTENKRRIVICESDVASKYSGMGGMGKTLTAKWYANEYEKEYDHILWIDCGEGSLFQSFKRLARDLKIEDRGELDLKEIPTKCFDELTEFTCLWIYDNAENYKKKDGVKDFLPPQNFYCIITSRSREWGTDKVGFGKIASLELDIFSDEETLTFLKSTLGDSIEHTDSQLKELGRLMGNLPLALQLAVAALIDGKIDLQNYIDKTSSEDLGNILDEEFDDYEKMINKNVKISLDLILEHANGKLAHDILMILGYIRADDVGSAFLMEILKTDETSLLKAISLLEKYNLVTKTKKLMNVEEDGLMSIHRLLQQVIRHNGRGTEEETLRKILGCEGFIDYKLLPFTKYANAKLQKEFPKVKAELLDQEQLTKLIREERFEESVRLVKFISEELHTNTSRFNYATCLAKNEQLEESVDLLEKLENEKMREEERYEKDDVRMGMLSLDNKVSRSLLYGHLFVLYVRLKNKERMQELLETRKLFQFIPSNESLEIFMRILHSDLTQYNYYFVKENSNWTHSRFDLGTFILGTESKEIELSSCSLDLCWFDRLSPRKLTLDRISFTRAGQKLEEVTVNEFIDLNNINQLTLIVNKSTNMCIDLSDVSLEYLCVHNVRLLGCKESKCNIERLTLEDFPFVEKMEMTIKEMKIHEVYGKPTLDISCLPRTLQKLDLRSLEVVCTGEIDLPALNYLKLKFMTDCSFLSSLHSVNITHIHFFNREINLDLLPKSVTNIKITDANTNLVGGVRRVDKLILKDFDFSDLEQFLSHFQPDELVVYNSYVDRWHDRWVKPNELIELTNKEIKKIAVGKVKWDKVDFNVLFNLFDRKSVFYLWEGGRGSGIEEEEFEELYKFY